MAKPLYLQIKDQIMEMIEGLNANDPIKSERDLSKEFNASRMTVRKSLDALVEEGLLYRDANRGTFVSDKEVILKNTLEEPIKDESYSLIYFDVKTSASKEVWEALNITASDSIVRMIRLKLQGEKPLAVEEVYIQRRNLSDSEVSDMANWRLFNAYVEKQGSIHHEFNPEMVPIKYANLLELKLGTPIIVVNSIIRSKRGDALVYRKSYNNSKSKRIEISSSI